MSTKKKVVIGGAIAAIGMMVFAVGAFGAYLFLLNDAPAPVDLATAIEAASTSTAETAAATPDATSASGGTGDLTGTWTVVADGSSFVGYRVQEELASIGATTAVGRTTVVSGTLTFDGSAITDVSLEADVSALESDQDRRDRALQQQALETDSYPTAGFVLTEPIELASVPAEGETIEVTAAGELTVHGVTQLVSIPLEGAFVDGRVVVVGSTTIEFADYDIEQPQALSVLSVDDQATLELQLVFAQA